MMGWPDCTKQLKEIVPRLILYHLTADQRGFVLIGTRESDNLPMIVLGWRGQRLIPNRLRPIRSATIS